MASASRITSLVATCVFLALATAVVAQPPGGGGGSPGGLSLFQIFFVNITQMGPSPALFAQRSSSSIPSETGIQVRLSLMFSMGEYNRQAACDPKALDSFGTKPSIPARFCTDMFGDDQAKIIAYLTLNSYRDVFPEEAMNWARYMVSSGSGLDPSASPSDENTPEGWGAKQGARISNFFKNDGWNQLGDLTKDNYRLAFQDSSIPPYKPVNPPQTDERKLPFPLRWAPLTQSVDGHGRFRSQVHVLPQIATDVRPLVLSNEDFNSRTTSSPYRFPNKRGSIAGEDRKTLEGHIDRLFKISANLVPTQIIQASFWDDKFTSSAAVSRHVERSKGIEGLEEAASRYGDALAQHDAIITAWKEKRRHDLVRPVTAIRTLRRGRRVRAYDPAVGRARRVRANEWEPLILTQPHSEFPSASATLCTATFEFVTAFVTKFAGNANVPPFVRPFFPMDSNFKTSRVVLSIPLKDAARMCGESRLWAGVHFPPAVDEGFKLGKGIGLAALEHTVSLLNGEIPDQCYWCPGRQ